MAHLARFAALVPLLSPGIGIEREAPPSELELASLAVTDRIAGGIVGPMPNVLLAAGYDRVKREFRVVRRRAGPEGDEVWVAELASEQFVALLELAVTSGLPELPVESPPGCTDVYGRNRQIRLDNGRVQWANGAPGGCVHQRSTVTPSGDERRRFDEVVARLEQAVDAQPLRRGDATELRRVPFLENVRALDTYRRVMAHVLADPVRRGLDLERARVFESQVTFALRGRRDELGGEVQFVIDRSGAVARVSSEGTGSTRDRVAPIVTGMTLAEVAECIGQPDEREERADGSLVLTYLPSLEDSPALPRLPARLRFENGRVSTP